MKLNNLLFYLLLIITCLSCEKPVIPDTYQGDANGNLVVSVFQLEQQQFAGTHTRAALADYCSTLNFAVYDADGQRIKQVNQKAADAGFGAVAFAVEPGTYQVVVVGQRRRKE